MSRKRKAPHRKRLAIPSSVFRDEVQMAVMAEVNRIEKTRRVQLLEYERIHRKAVFDVRRVKR